MSLSPPRRSARRFALALFVLAVFALGGASTASAAVQGPTEYDGNPKCSTLGAGYTELHVEGSDVGKGDHQDTVNGNLIKWTIDNDQKIVTKWTSTIALDAVIVKGGDNGNAYVYNPAANQGGPLTSPLNNGGQRPAISNIKFCWKPKGKIRIVKDVFEGTDAQDFTFTTQSPQGGTQLPSSFKVDDDGAGDNFVEFSVVAGSYTITESDIAGWSLKGLFCDDAPVAERLALALNKTSTTSGASATFEVDGTETITCTWVNDRDPEPQDASITVVKKTNPAGDPSSFPFTIDENAVEVKAFSLKDTQSNTTIVEPGTYEIDEAIPAGWTLDSISCVDTDEEEVILLAFGPGDATYDTAAGTAEVEVEAGDNIECTYTNRKLRGTIRVEKLATPADATAFPFTADGPGGLDESFSLKAGEATDAIAVDAGTVTIDEAIPTGWRLKSVSCTGGGTSDLATGTTTVDVSDGENVTCTYTNEKIPATTTTTTTTTPSVQQVQAASIQAPQQVPARAAAPARRVAGRARMQGPSGCVSRPFSVRVRGRQIESVSFFVGNRRIRTLKAKAAQSGDQSLSYRIDPKGLRQGRITRVTARVRFTTASGTETRSLRIAVQRCRAAVAPTFTG